MTKNICVCGHTTDEHNGFGRKFCGKYGTSAGLAFDLLLFGDIKLNKRELQKLETGEHIFLNEDFRKDILLPAIQKSNTKRVLEGTHNFFDPSIRQKALESTLKKQRELLSMGKHQSQFEWICPNCKKSGKGKGAFSRFHGDNCKFRYEPLEL